MTKKKKVRDAKVKRYPILLHPKKGVKYISVIQAAKRLKVPLPTVYGWAAKGLFQFITKDETGHWMIPSKGLKKPPVPGWHYRSSTSNKSISAFKALTFSDKKKKKPEYVLQA